MVKSFLPHHHHPHEKFREKLDHGRQGSRHGIDAGPASTQSVGRTTSARCQSRVMWLHPVGAAAFLCGTSPTDPDRECVRTCMPLLMVHIKSASQIKQVHLIFHIGIEGIREIVFSDRKLPVVINESKFAHFF